MGSMTTGHGNGHQSAVMTRAFSPEEKRQALEEVLVSKAFARSDQLKRFLRYICDMELAGRGDEIQEYSIAVEALGRPPSYSPGEDSAVRSRAYALRQKLNEFYESERPEAFLRIDLHKGSYRPNFIDWTEQSRREAEESPRAAVSRAPLSIKAFLAGALAVLIVGSAAAFLLLPRLRTNRLDPVLRDVWGSLVQPGADVSVYVGCPPNLLLKSFHDGEAPSRRLLLPAPAEVDGWYANLHMLDGGGSAYMMPNRDFALFGDAVALATAAKVLSSAGVSFNILPELSYRPLAVRGRNVVLIAAPNYSQYVAQVLKDAPFTIRYDPEKRDEVIAEGPSGRSVFVTKRDQYLTHTEVFGRVTVLPRFVTATASEKTVIFSGISTFGTQAAMEYFASPACLRELLQKFRQDGYKEVPPSYQVVVRYNLDRVVPPKWSYAAHAIIKTPQPAQ